jgi:acetyltransferase-like isoleucine patch superfamily enzyme
MATAKLAAKKGLVANDLQGWNAAELASLGGTIASRLLRGQMLRLRLGPTAGLVLCERNVRVVHGRHVSAGKLLNLEDGCEIVGLAKRGVVFGERCTVGRLATIRPTNILLDEPGEGMRMGDNSNIGAYSFIGCSGYIEIGNEVMMGPNITLLAESHNFDDSSRSIKQQGISRSTITIEDDCWIGASATILPGVTIGCGSVVAAGAIVTKDVAPYSIVAGVPARLIGSRRPDEARPRL